MYLVYRGLGAVSDMVAGEIGRQARIKRQYERRTGKPPTYQQLREKLLGRNLPKTDELFADGGDIDFSEFTSTLPKRAVVDLRETIWNAPFNVSPMAFDRVEKNAQAGAVGLGRFGPIAQAGLIIGAMFMGGLMVWFAINNGGGGGGGGISGALPLVLGVGGWG